MTHRPTRLAVLFSLALCLLVTGRAGAQPVVTSDGFDALIAKSTLYARVPMIGVVGDDSPGVGVHATLDAAADSEHIHHAVFMVDSESGGLLDREVVGVFDGQLEITAVVDNAIAPAIFPVFFADHIYMTETALIGGLPLSVYVDKGSEEVTAKQVGIFSSMLASAAQSRGHPDAVAYAMINEKQDLYYWVEDGEPRLSNSEPSNTQSRRDYEKIQTVIPSLTLVLDRDLSVKVGLAKPIDDFDDMIVGEYLGLPGWLPANNFGRVANEIGSVIAELEPLREEIRMVDSSLAEIRVDRNNRTNEDEGFRQFKQNLDKAVEQIDAINESLTELLKVHPERLPYFVGPNHETIVEDAEQWQSDADQAFQHMRQAFGMLQRLNKNFDGLSDKEFLYDLNQRMQGINDRLNDIRRHGNAKYWAEHAEPDLPDDIYG